MGHGGLAEFANSLRGFPCTGDDMRTLELGTFNPNHADGGVRIHFYCDDSSGHAIADIKLRGDACKALGESESVALRMPVQAAAIDSFVRQLEKVDPTLGANASLPMAT